MPLATGFFRAFPYIQRFTPLGFRMEGIKTGFRWSAKKKFSAFRHPPGQAPSP